MVMLILILTFVLMCSLALASGHQANPQIAEFDGPDRRFVSLKDPYEVCGSRVIQGALFRWF